jgi:tight adherence protein C
MNRFHAVLVLLVLLPMLTIAIYLVLSDARVAIVGNPPSLKKSPRSYLNKLNRLSTFPFAVALFLLIVNGSLPLVILFVVTGCLVVKYERETSVRSGKRAQAEMANELPAIVEVFSILVSGGESLPVALNRVAQRATGSLAKIMQNSVRELRQGSGLIVALDTLAREAGVPEVRRFCDTLIVALERGTSLSDVLARQIQEIRSRQHAKLLIAAGRAEVGLLIPVVFLILPISVLFALWPSYLSLNLSVGV